MTKKKRTKIKKELSEMLDAFDYEYLLAFAKRALAVSIDNTNDTELQFYYDELKKLRKENA